MTRVKAAVDGEKYDLAIRLLNAIIEIKPNYVEAWNRRATVFFLKKDYANALADLAKVLVLEPRHFGALTGLGAIMQDLGDDEHRARSRSAPPSPSTRICKASPTR